MSSATNLLNALRVYDIRRKCPEISNTKFADQMVYANIADPDQMIRVYTVCHSTKYFKKHLHKKQN